MRSTVLTALATAGLVLAGAAGASAQPPSAQELTLDCGDAGTYTAWVVGHGDWATAHDTKSNLTFVPVWFGNQSVTVKLPDGKTVTMNDPAQYAKGNGKVRDNNPSTATACTFVNVIRLTEETRGFPAGSVVTYRSDALVYIR